MSEPTRRSIVDRYHESMKTRAEKLKEEMVLHQCHQCGNQMTPKERANNYVWASNHSICDACLGKED